MLQDLCSFKIQPYRRKYLNEYFQRMSTDQLKPLFDDNVADVLREQGYDIRDNPRSVYKVSKLYEALAKYAPSQAPVIDMQDQYVRQGVNLAYACFSRPKSEPYLDLEPFTPELVYKVTTNKQGSAGLTAWGQTKAESYVRAYERGLQQIKGEKRWEPCIAFKRTQFEDKTRLVWGYPYAATAIEGIFARPLLQRFKEGCTPMAFGKSTGVLGTELRVSSYHNEFAYSTDVSSFDSSIDSDLIVVAFKILSTWFDLTQSDPTSGVKYLKIWNQIRYYFIHTPIVMPDGNVYKGKEHGVPSGSYFTQMIDSIVNVIIVGAISAKFHLDISRDDINVLGDDILFWCDRDVTLDEIAQYASKTFSIRLNANKSGKYRYNEVIHFLGRVWDNGMPTLESEGILDRMSQPETFRQYSKNKVNRKVEARKLLLSYASVYEDAYPIYLRCMGKMPRYGLTNASIERYAYGGTLGDINPNFLSGLERFKRKYLGEPSGGNVPLALQYWK